MRQEKIRFRFRQLATPRKGVIDRRDVLELLATQFGVIAADQLRALGIGRTSIWRAVTASTMVSVLPGIFRVAGQPASFESDAMAVQLLTGAGGTLSGPTAARIYGLRQMPGRPIYRLTRSRSRTDVPAWVSTIHSSWLDLGLHVTTVGSFRVLRPCSMLFTLAEVFNDFRFERAAEDAWHLNLVSPDDAAAFLELYRRQGRSGVTRFDRWLAKTAARSRPSQSGFEMDFLAAIRQVGLPEPRRQHPLTLAHGETIHLDFAWPDVRLAVEPGAAWWHGGDLKTRKDMARDRACTLVGWQVARFDDAARRNLHGAAAEVAAIYAMLKSS